MKRSVATLLFFILTAVFLAVAQIVTAAAFTTSGTELSELDAKTQDLVKENTLLGEKVYQLASLTSVEKRATDMGFSEDNKSRLVLGNPAPVAYNR